MVDNDRSGVGIGYAAAQSDMEFCVSIALQKIFVTFWRDFWNASKVIMEVHFLSVFNKILNHFHILALLKPYFFDLMQLYYTVWVYVYID